MRTDYILNTSHHPTREQLALNIETDSYGMSLCNVVQEDEVYNVQRWYNGLTFHTAVYGRCGMVNHLQDNKMIKIAAIGISRT